MGSIIYDFKNHIKNGNSLKSNNLFQAHDLKELEVFLDIPIFFKNDIEVYSRIMVVG